MSKGLLNLADLMVEDILQTPDDEILAECSPEEIKATRAAFERASDRVLLDRALGILHRMATERTGWRSFFSRWYYPDEPLRNDAANLVREARYGAMMPAETQLVGYERK